MEQAITGKSAGWQTGAEIPGIKVALTMSISIPIWNLEIRMHLIQRGMEVARSTNDGGGKGGPKSEFLPVMGRIEVNITLA